MKMGLRVKRVVEHLWGPTGSVLLHVLLILLLCKLIVVRPPPEPADLVVVRIEQQISKPPPPDWDHEVDDMDLEYKDMDMTYTPVDVKYDTPISDDFSPDVITPIRNLSPLVISLGGDTFKPLSKTFGNRSAAGISENLRKYSDRYGRITEPAVFRALEWLSKNQHQNGSWGPDRLERKKDQKYAVGLTGLAILTFLAHGETPQHGRFQLNVKRGLQFLTSQQDSVRGSFTSINNAPGNNDYAPYAHAIATYAISEAYGLTRISGLKGVMEKALQPIIEGQMPDGGWAYGYDNASGARKDLSVMGWQVQALKSAAIAGAGNQGLYASLSNAVHGIALMQLSNGRFVYSAHDSMLTGSGTDSMTGVGVLCLQLLGYGKRSEARAGLRALKEVKCKWAADSWGSGLHHTRSYDYYYITQAKFQEGKGTWRQWNRHMAAELVEAQHEEGFWLGPESENSMVHKVYNTTLAALTLQVYYRFLPTYKPIQPKEEISQIDDDDIHIDII